MTLSSEIWPCVAKFPLVPVPEKYNTGIAPEFSVATFIVSLFTSIHLNQHPNPPQCEDQLFSFCVSRRRECASILNAKWKVLHTAQKLPAEKWLTSWKSGFQRQIRKAEWRQNCTRSWLCHILWSAVRTSGVAMSQPLPLCDPGSSHLVRREAPAKASEAAMRHRAGCQHLDVAQAVLCSIYLHIQPYDESFVFTSLHFRFIYGECPKNTMSGDRSVYGTLSNSGGSTDDLMSSPPGQDNDTADVYNLMSLRPQKSSGSTPSPTRRNASKPRRSPPLYGQPFILDDTPRSFPVPDDTSRPYRGQGTVPKLKLVLHANDLLRIERRTIV